ncbi:glycosyltransferase family 2 protein [Marisediminicola senii]|uniref:glycosyltransferase family 2 protein n=1 Tax=Marisediminicola senii TaxID=2711233 RepID=UPI0013EAAAF8|nr:glycosyltransferase family 2 protein [Marisediminicola senii]
MRIISGPRRLVTKLIRGPKRFVKKTIKDRLLAGRFASRVFGRDTPLAGEAVVLMCLWNRPARLRETLALLDAQDYAGGVRLYLWNNKRRDHPLYLRALREYVADGGTTRVELVKSPFNLGSIARFYWARKLALAGYTGPVIVIDDDENFDETFVSTAIAHYRPEAVTAWWAFFIGVSYWERGYSVVGGQVDHIGPGGMVCAASIFLDDEFFTQLPDRFWLMDDIWLSHYAKTRGLTLAKLPVEITMVLEETNQYHSMVAVKEEFYRYLNPGTI